MVDEETHEVINWWRSADRPGRLVTTGIYATIVGTVEGSVFV